MPVAHAEIDRQGDACRHHAVLQSLDLTLGNCGQRRDAAEALVVARYVLDTLRRYAPVAQDIGQKRSDVFEPFGAAERDDEDGIEGTRNRGHRRSRMMGHSTRALAPGRMDPEVRLHQLHPPSSVLIDLTRKLGRFASPVPE